MKKQELAQIELKQNAYHMYQQVDLWKNIQMGQKKSFSVDQSMRVYWNAILKTWMHLSG